MLDSINDVIARMRAIGDAIDPDDGVGHFNTVYQNTTEAIRDRLNEGFFADASFVEQLDVIFANRYFAAVDANAAGRPVDYAWQPLFEQRADARIRAIQFVVAGMNAHINQDLSLATVDACTRAGTDPLAGSIPDDYRRINEVLEQIESKTRRSLLSEHVKKIDEPVEPLMHLLGAWSIVRAREAAWVRIHVLWLLRAQRQLFDRSVTVSSKAVGMTSRHLLAPVVPDGLAARLNGLPPSSDGSLD